MTKKLLLALVLFATAGGVHAHAPCAVDPKAKDAEACELAGPSSTTPKRN